MNARHARLPRSLSVLVALAAACGGDPTDRTQDARDETPAPSNRIDVPPIVRRNLGIEFVPVERRHVRATLRLPARVELLPTATQHYRAPYGGRVQLRVEPLQRVRAGDVLYTIDSREWREEQRRLASTASAITIAETRLASMQAVLLACEEHEKSLRDAFAVTESYVEDLRRAERDVGGQAQKIATARVELAQIGAQLADASEKHTETQTRIRELQTEVRTQEGQFELLLAGAAAQLGVDPEQLRDGERAWRELRTLDVLALAEGVVQEIVVASGSLVDPLGPVLTTIDPSRVRCRAQALQSDAGRLRDGQPARIVPAGGTTGAADAYVGQVQVAPTGDARTRTLDVFVLPNGDAPTDVPRPGTAVFVEIDTSADGHAATPPLVIPSAAVLPDGLERVFFRRDPKDPNRVIRVVADLGHDDGAHVEVKSGLMDGDEVVLDGAFELVLASSSQSQKGGHFHADGTWHEDH